eukprot:10367226-Alexandrium_andersonii.AAC.1
MSALLAASAAPRACLAAKRAPTTRRGHDASREARGDEGEALGCLRKRSSSGQSWPGVGRRSCAKQTWKA